MKTKVPAIKSNIVGYIVKVLAIKKNFVGYVVLLAETHDTPISSLKLEFYNGKVQPCKLTVDNPRKNPVLYFLTQIAKQEEERKICFWRHCTLLTPAVVAGVAVEWILWGQLKRNIVSTVTLAMEPNCPTTTAEKFGSTAALSDHHKKCCLWSQTEAPS